MFNVSNEKFLKRGLGMGEVLKFVTLDGGLRIKKRKKNLRFLQKMFFAKKKVFYKKVNEKKNNSKR